jgi:hypothetical protein
MADSNNNAQKARPTKEGARPGAVLSVGLRFQGRPLAHYEVMKDGRWIRVPPDKDLPLET